jgi:aminopeptidase N
MKPYLFLFLSISVFAQQSLKVDFVKMNALVTPNATEKSISGNVSYDFKVLSTVDTIKIDAINMIFTNLKINNKTIQYLNTGKQLQLYKGFKKGKNKLTFSYKATPKLTLYFIGQMDHLQIWTQGQGKYTSHWLPSFDDVNEKVIFNLAVQFDKDFQILSNGCLKKTEINQDKIVHYQMKKPMSSYLVMLAIGQFDRKELQSKSGIPLEFYLKRQDSSKFESTYKYAKEIFDFFEAEIGVKYPWKVYRQVPVNDFLYAGMENTSSTIFSQEYVVDAIGYNDQNYLNVNAHELAHQWFGDLITAQSGKDHWLQEGFATYYALLAEKELFGEDHFYFEMLKMANELAEASTTDLIPIYNEKASSLSFYKKGAWALFVLDQAIGHENFQKAIKNYLQKYQYKNVTTDDFLAEIKKTTSFEVENFKKDWLEKAGFEVKTVLELLSKNKFVKELFDLQALYPLPFLEKKNTFETILKSNHFYPIKQEIISQIMDVPFEDKKELLSMAMQTHDLNVRQAIAETTQIISPDFKPQYESLLLDNSYRTREIALVTLCKQFPEEKQQYLEQSQNWVGFNNKNLRITWLSLALTTPLFQIENQTKFSTELIDYSSNVYDSSIRQNALEVLLMINPDHPKILSALVNATIHHKWQFVKFGKDNIRILLKNEQYRKLFENLMIHLGEKEQNQLNKLLKEI